MPKFSEFAPLGIAIFLGASGALAFQYVAAAPGDPAETPPTYMTVESEAPQVRFAVISNGLLETTEEFVTPARIRITDPEISLMVVPLDADGALTVGTSRIGSFKARSGGTGYAFHRLTSRGVTARSFPRGDLEEALASSGLSFTGVEFGRGVACVQPEVWDLVLAERLAEARAACLERTKEP